MELYEQQQKRNIVSGTKTGQEELPGAVPMGKEQPRDTKTTSIETGTTTGREHRERPTITGERPSTRITPSKQKELNEKIELLLKEKGDNPDNYTSEDKKLLEQYTGSGGLAKAGVKKLEV